MGFFPSVGVSKQYVRLLAVFVGAFVLLLSLKAIGADAQKMTHTQNQSCDPVQTATAGQYDTSIQCRLQLTRPATDTGSDLIRLGVFFPAEFPGVTAWEVPGFVCSQQAQEGMPTRFLCTGNLAKGGSIPVKLTLHVKGACGTEGGIRSQVNQADILSNPTDTEIPFPTCDGALNTGANTSAQNSMNAAAQNNTLAFQANVGSSLSASSISTSSSSSSRTCYYCMGHSSVSTSSVSTSSLRPSLSSVSSHSCYYCLSYSSSSVSSLGFLPSSSSSSSYSSMIFWSSASSLGSFACSDGIDNDGDGTSDQFDFSCFGPNDNDETNPLSACQDFQDNDGDGLIDFPQDPGCQSKQDNDENNQVAGYQATAGTTNVNVNITGNGGSQQPYLITYQTQSSSYSSQIPQVAGFRNSETLIAAFPGSVTMTKRADKSEARPGDYLWYTITVRNNSDTAVNGLTLDDTYLSSDFTVTDAGGGAATDGRVQWLNGNLQPREVKTLRYQVRLGDHLTHQYVVRNTVTLSGGDISSPVTATAEVGIMKQMPATGAIKLKPLMPRNPFEWVLGNKYVW
jgi:uncharacterized repeat protein (TIGR01451 family)